MNFGGVVHREFKITLSPKVENTTLWSIEEDDKLQAASPIVTLPGRLYLPRQTHGYIAIYQCLINVGIPISKGFC